MEALERGWRDLHASNFPTPEGLWVSDRKPVRAAILSYSTLRDMYRRCSFIRPCVDAIIRTISGCRWAIVGRGPQDIRNRVIRLFSFPNPNKMTFQLFIRQVLMDLVVLDEAYIEKVRSPTGEIVELYPLDASLVNPLLDEEGNIEAFEVTKKEGLVELSAKDVIYMRLYPRTNSQFGTPIIETIVNEVVALMYSVKTIADAFEEDEIPPGILHLGKIGIEAYNRAKEAFRESRGERGKRTMAVIDNVDICKWVDFTRPFREMQLAELIERIERIVYKNFGIFTMEMQNLRGLPIGTAREMHKITYSQLIRPIMRLIEDFFNTEIVKEFWVDLSFEWILEPVEDPETKARTLAVLVDRGIITKNEAREMLGLEILPEGEGLQPRPVGRPPKLETFSEDIEMQLKPKKFDGKEIARLSAGMTADLRDRLEGIYDDYERRISDAIRKGRSMPYIERLVLEFEDKYTDILREFARRQAKLSRRIICDILGRDIGGGAWERARERFIMSQWDRMRGRMLPEILSKAELAFANKDWGIFRTALASAKVSWVTRLAGGLVNLVWSAIEPWLIQYKKKVRWMGILDERTCPDCEERIGEEFIPEEDFIWPKSPELQCNGNCRCWIE